MTKRCLAATTIALAFGLAACPKKQDEPKRDEATKPTTEATTPDKTATPPPQQPAPSPTGSAPAGSGATIGGLPAECNQYKELVDKLATCEKLGAQRDTLKANFDESWKAWAALPPDSRASVAPACKAAADSLRTTAAAACGW
ncbi:MAG TPA: hypothetical protein VFQ53_27165 [Kofleriaceae bacterium]|nr:hypothetical protein [Kofleriaceae bacterium]